MCVNILDIYKSFDSVLVLTTAEADTIIRHRNISTAHLQQFKCLPARLDPHSSSRITAASAGKSFTIACNKLVDLGMVRSHPLQ